MAYLYGTVDSDSINGTSGEDYIYGGVSYLDNPPDTGSDTLNGNGGDDHIYGFGGDDLLDGGSGNDVVRAFAGNDLIYGSTGNDRLIGDAGNDTMLGGAGSDTFDGGAGFDYIDYELASGSVTVNLAFGTSSGAEDADQFADAFEGLIGSTYDDLLTGNALGNTINAYLGNDFVDGDEGNDYLQGDEGNDTLVGSAGADTLVGGGGDDAMYGGTSFDFADYTSAGGAVTVDLSNNTATGSAGTDLLFDIEGLLGSGFADTLTGNSVSNRINGGAGLDTLAGGGGSDIYYLDDMAIVSFFPRVRAVRDTVMENVDGGLDQVILTPVDGKLFGGGRYYALPDNVENASLADLGPAANYAFMFVGNSLNNFLQGGNDATIDGGSGDDTIYGGSTGIHLLQGGEGNDRISALGGTSTLIGGAGNDTFFGSSGTETVDYGSASGGVSVNLDIGTLQNTGGDGIDLLNTTSNLLYRIENIAGSGFADKLSGDANNNVLIGRAGNDTLSGAAGADTMQGGAGDDRYVVNSAGDVVSEIAGEGTDTVIAFVNLSLSDEVERLVLGGNGQLNGIGNGLSNKITGNSSNNNLSGHAGNDSLAGAAGNDTVKGDNGNDTVFGGDDNDLLHGGKGKDVLKGGADNDTLFGDLGRDSLTGGNGLDVFKFNHVIETGSSTTTCDVVTDFAKPFDKIDLSAIDANGAGAGNTAFAFVGTAAFSKAGQLDYITLAGDTYIRGNIDADATPEFMIKLDGLFTLAKGDFLL